METYSLRIENLLCKLSPEMKGMRAIIAQNPYKEIYKVLNGRVLTKILEEFEMSYQGINGKSLADLQVGGYDITILIADLVKIIENFKG